MAKKTFINNKIVENKVEKIKLPMVSKNFWTDWKLNPNSAINNLSFEYECSLNLNLPNLIKSLKNYIMEVNPLCHCQFIQNTGDIIAIKDKTHLFNLRLEENLLESENHKTIRDNFFSAPFNLEAGNVYRFLISKNDQCYSILVCFHHIVLDTRTYTHFINTTANYYNDLTFSSNTYTPPSLTIKDFHHKEQELFKQNDINEILKSFKADTLQVNLFPTSSAKPVASKITGRSFHFELDENLQNKLYHFTKNRVNKTTTFRVLMAVYALLLHFYSRQKSISISYPVNICPSALSEIGGACINMLPMSFDFNEKMSFLQILEHINTQTKQAKKYQYIPFHQLQAYLKQHKRIGEFDQPNVCLSETLGLLRQEFPDFKGVNVKPLPLEVFEPLYDITFCYGITDKILFQINYDTTKFSAGFVKTLSQQFVQLLANCIDEPDQLVMVNNLSADKKNQQIVLHNKQLISPASLAAVFYKTAQQFPNKTALSFLEKSYSYKQLNEMSNQWATYIFEHYTAVYGHAMPKETLIGLSTERNLTMLIGLLAILKLGAVYVPIDPKNPRDRIDYIINDSQLSLVLTQSDYINLFSSIDTNKILLLNDVATLNDVKQLDNKNLNILISQDDLAYIIYTSGSTGKPKGVMVSHYNVLRLFSAAKEHYHFTSNDIWSLFHSIAFDFSVWEIWGAFCYGGNLKIVPYEISRDPRTFYHWLKKENITVLNQTPSAFEKLVEQDGGNDTSLTSLRYIIFGGEALKFKALRHWSDKYALSQPKLVNMYGITETTVHVTFKELTKDDIELERKTIGVPLQDLSVCIIDEDFTICPVNIPGEICILGDGVTRGYLHREALTQQKFISTSQIQGLNLPSQVKIYRSGDLGRLNTDGELDYLGRIDQQVKVRGFRVELGEIESMLSRFPHIEQAAVVVDNNENQTLTAYYKPKKGYQIELAQLRQFLGSTLPDYMIPQILYEITEFPLNHNGKVDSEQLSTFITQNKFSLKDEHLYNEINSTEVILKNIWAEVLNQGNISIHDSFFTIGGDSFSVIQVRDKIEERFNTTLNIVDLFEHSTIKKLAGFIDKCVNSNYVVKNAIHDAPIYMSNNSKSVEDIAVVGLSCRLPHAATIDQFWEMLLDKKSSIRDMNDEELKAAMVSPTLLNDENFVKRASILDSQYSFDASFFGYSPKEAELMDPQQRQFIECAWEALEHSGNIPEKFNGDIGVFASQGKNFYYLDRIYNHSNGFTNANAYQTMLANEKDFLSTRVSHKLNLTGPSMNLQTGCSSSLVSIYEACQSLKNYDCDLALAGGVALFNKNGYVYQPGMIESSDGYCRSFDTNAGGTVAGSGVGIVVLKRLSDAIRDKDTVYAVVKGGAINNDGADKISFTAPSIQGQRKIIERALTNAHVSAKEISYVEAHGTGTNIGDPIECKALHQVYEKNVSKKHSCTLGAVKTNIGHTDAAAGVLGFIKTVLALKHKVIPATLNFTELNPEIAAFNFIFKVSSQTQPWYCEQEKRYAAVSAFGIGGTNVHMILAEYPNVIHTPAKAKGDYFIIPFSAKTEQALVELEIKLRHFIETRIECSLSDIAFTAQTARSTFNKKRYLIVEERNKARTIHCRHSITNEAAEPLITIGEQWCQGSSVDWHAINTVYEYTRKIAIPTYPFEKKQYEIKNTITNKEIQAIKNDETRYKNYSNKLKNLWSEAIGIAQNEITHDDNFIALGGDSLAYIDLLTGIKKEFSLEVNLEQLVEIEEFHNMLEFITTFQHQGYQ